MNNGDVLTIAQGSAGLVFFPAANSNATGHFTAHASIGATDAGLGGSVTADVLVDPVPDAPVITPATTLEDTKTTSGLVITRNAADGPEITHFQILDIFNGTLFQNDGATEIHAGDVITAAQGGAGLRFMPAPNFSGSADFLVIGVFDAAGTVSGTPVINGGIITVTAVADTPTFTGATTIVNQATTSGLVVTRNAVDGNEVGFFKVIAVDGGVLTHRLPAGGIIIPGSFVTMAEASTGLRFDPMPNFAVGGHVTIQASMSADNSGLGGALVTADIVINPLPSTTVVTTSGSPSHPSNIVFFTATVAPALAGASGTVQFKDGGNNIGAPVALSSGTATVSTSTLTPGLHTITAVYSGNSLAAASTGTLAGGQFVRLPVTVSISSSGNPTPLAQPVTLTITVAPTVTGSGTPTGSVSVIENTTTIGSVALTGGTASFTSSSFTLGVHHLIILYNSDATFTGGGAGFDQTISCPVITIHPATIPPAVIGVPYSQTFTQSGGVGTTAFSLTGALPAGLTFDIASATLSGVPQTPGTYPIAVTATPANGCGAMTASYSLLVGGARTVLVGADAGGVPFVRRFSALDGSAPTTGPVSDFFAFDPLFSGGVRVAEGDVNGDGQPDYITSAGTGASPDIRIYDGATGALVRTIVAFEPAFRGGVFVAAGDVDGDGYADVIAGSGPGRSGQVRVFSGRDGTVLRDTAMFTPSFTGGVHVAAGDVNGDGAADLIVGSGEGMSATVRILSGNDLSVLRTLTPYGGFPFGVWVAAGDVTGDGFADVITGADAGGGPHVKVFDGVTGAEVRSFFAFSAAFAGGVRVAAGDVTGDGKAEIIVGAGPGGAPEVRVFDGTTSALVSTLMAYPEAFTGGVFVATAAPQHRMSIDIAGRSGGGGSASGPGGADRRPDIIAGWAFVENFHDPGIGAIHVWALPVGGGAPVFVGVGTLGDARPDVAAHFGQQYANAGFHLDISRTVPRGTYDLAVFAQSALTGTFEIVRVVRVTLTP